MVIVPIVLWATKIKKDVGLSYIHLYYFYFFILSAQLHCISSFH